MQSHRTPSLKGPLKICGILYLYVIMLSILKLEFLNFFFLFGYLRLD